MWFGRVALIGGCVLVGLSAPAIAANDGRPDADLLIDALTTYARVDDARHACGDDTVVWADRYDGFYYGNRDASFGATRDGSYACEADARKARYWSTDPRSSMDGHRGRTFPFARLFQGS